MKFSRNLKDFSRSERGCALTIGNFDGVHRGHQAILDQLGVVADERGLPSVLMTFEPHPREFFDRKEATPRLTRLAEKLLLLKRSALDHVLCLPFNRAFSEQTAETFIDKLLVAELAVRVLIVGDDFRFGFRGQGDVTVLRAAGERYGFNVFDCDTFVHEGRRVSSTWVREVLADGNIPLAQQLLGHAYRIRGRVGYGDQLGRTIGFPTANIAFGRRQLPLSGVFAVEVYGLGAETLPGVCNVGVRPTVQGQQLRLEVHLLDFDQDIYGATIEVEFLHRLRPERRFESLPALQTQIGKDIQAARELFGLKQ